MPAVQAASMSASGGKRLVSSSSVMPCAKAQAARARSAIPARGLVDRAAGALLDARDEQVAAQLLIGHQAVEVGVGTGEAPVGRGDVGERLGASVDGLFEDLGLLLEGGRDDRRFERRLVGEVLVERGRADPEALCDAPHGERLETLVVQDLAGGGDDLARPRGEAVRSAGSHRACASRSRRCDPARCGTPRRARRSGSLPAERRPRARAEAGPQ